MNCRSFLSVVICVLSFQNLFSSQTFSSESSMLQRFLQSSEQKMGKWDPLMRDSGSVLTNHEIDVISERLDLANTKVYYGPSQMAESGDQNLLTVTVLCRYLANQDSIVDDRMHYPQFIYGSITAQDLGVSLNN